MKKSITLAALAAVLTVGCANISYKNGSAEVTVNRFFWSSQSYEVSISTNGFSTLKCVGSGADTKALGEMVGAGISAYQKSQTGGL